MSCKDKCAVLVMHARNYEKEVERERASVLVHFTLMAQGRMHWKGTRKHISVSLCWPKVPSCSVPLPGCCTLFILCISTNSRMLLSEIKVESKVVEVEGLLLMLSSFFPTRGPWSSEYTNVRRRDRMDWLDLTMATALIENHPRCSSLCCHFFSKPQKFRVAESFLNLCFVPSTRFSWAWWNLETLFAQPS